MSTTPTPPAMSEQPTIIDPRVAPQPATVETPTVRSPAVEPSMERTIIHIRNALATKELCQIVKEIVGSLYGQVLPEIQVKDLCNRIQVIQDALVGKTTSQPLSGSRSTTSSPPSNRQPCSDCGRPYPTHREGCSVLRNF